MRIQGNKKFTLLKKGIIDDFLNCWASLDQRKDVKPCIFVNNYFDVITGFVDGEQYF